MKSAGSLEVAVPPDRPQPLKLGPVRRWILVHDESWLFVASYTGLAVVLSIWISLFWLVAIVGAHLLLEWIRQRHFHPHPPAVLARACWELKLDFALILFAMTLSAYMDVMLGMAGLAGAARLTAQTSSRAAGWARVLRGCLLSLDDVAQLSKAAFVKRAPAGEKAGAQEQFRLWGGWNQKWSFGDWLTLLFAAACVAGLLVAPLFTDRDFSSLTQALAAELHPWP